MTVTLTAGDAAATIDPADGARLTSLLVAGHELISGSVVADTPPVIGRGSYPMVPWAGRIKDGVLDRGGRRHRFPVMPDGHALHGFGLHRAWATEADGTFSCRIGDPWPGEGVARLAYDLTPAALTMTLSWEGDAASLPVALGLHPWFPKTLAGADAVLRFDAAQMVERGADGLPTGRLVAPKPRPWDDCFTGLAADPVIEWPEVLTLTLSADTDWWVVFDEQPGAFCVEPQTAPADAFRHPALHPAEDATAWPTSVRLTLTWRTP